MHLLIKQRYHDGIINREGSKIRYLEFKIVSVRPPTERSRGQLDYKHTQTIKGCITIDIRLHINKQNTRHRAHPCAHTHAPAGPVHVC